MSPFLSSMLGAFLRLRWLYWPVIAVAGLGLLAIAVAYRCYRAERFCFFPTRAEVFRPQGFDELGDVSFPNADGRPLRGWYVKSKNRAAVVLIHGSCSSRLSLLPEAELLAAAGFGVLLFDMPGHGESDGSVHWSAAERAAVKAAVHWLAEQSDVSRERIGALGFSMGGFVLAQTAPSEPAISAIAIAAAPPDASSHTRWEYRRWGPVGQWAAFTAARRAGLKHDEPQPIAVIAGIAPRPLLIIAGDHDNVVPDFMTRALHEAAKQPKELFIVRGAGHGDYISAAPVEYPARLVKFFRSHLLA